MRDRALISVDERATRRSARGLSWALTSWVVVAVLFVACGRTDLLDDGLDAGPAATPDSAVVRAPDTGVPSTCGDGTCEPSETCETCSVDCGLCPTCGDGQCVGGETCTGCPQDCGVCTTCGNGICKDGETCLSCAPDCGPCPSCGDGKCEASNENCYTCPADCGNCSTCGDGVCEVKETCASCEEDCGPCDFCGDGKCESPYETCVNCPTDCGACKLLGCPEQLTCAIGCVDLGASPPMISASCIGDCFAEGCPAAAFFFNNVVQCFIDNIGTCGGASIGCLMNACSAPIGACLGKLTCN